MKVLMPITPWLTKNIERGRTTGEDSVYRIVLGNDLWNWIVATELQKDGKLYNRYYLPSIKAVLGYISKIEDIDEVDFLTKLVIVISEQTNSNTQNMPRMPMDPFGIASWIDVNFETSYTRQYPPTIYQRLYNTEEGADD